MSRRRGRLSVCVALGLLGVALAGCGETGQAASPPTATTTATATVTVTETPSEPIGLRATSLTDLRSQLTANGFECQSWKVVSQKPGLYGSGQCDDLNQMGWYEITDPAAMSFYHASVNLATNVIASQSRSDVAVLIGDNVWVRMATSDAEIMQSRIGGVIFEIPDSSSTSS